MSATSPSLNGHSASRLPADAPPERVLHDQWAAQSRAKTERAEARRRRKRGDGELVFSGILGASSPHGWYSGWSDDRIELASHYKHWVYVAVRKIAETVAGIEPAVATVLPPRKSGTARAGNPGLTKSYLRSRHGNTKSQQQRPEEQLDHCDQDHPLCRLFRYPNAVDTGGDLFFELMLFLELTGNSYPWAVPSEYGRLTGRGEPAELWVVPSHWLRPILANGRLPDHYLVLPLTSPGGLKLPPEEVIHARWKSPVHKIDGYSAQRAVAEEIDSYESTQQARYWQFHNGAFPAGSIELGENYGDPDDQEMERIYAKFFARLQGTNNYGRPVILPPGAKYSPLTIEPDKMLYVESVEQLRDFILAAFGVPKEVVGVEPAGNDLSRYAPLQSFHRETIGPKLRYLGQLLTRHLASRWGDDLRVWFPDSSPEDPQELTAKATMFLAQGLATRDEVRQMYDMEPLGGMAGELLVPQGLAPIDDAGQQPGMDDGGDLGALLGGGEEEEVVPGQEEGEQPAAMPGQEDESPEADDEGSGGGGWENLKNFPPPRYKGRGQPCKPGETAESDGCIPSDKKPGGGGAGGVGTLAGVKPQLHEAALRSARSEVIAAAGKGRAALRQHLDKSRQEGRKLIADLSAKGRNPDKNNLTDQEQQAYALAISRVREAESALKGKVTPPANQKELLAQVGRAARDRELNDAMGELRGVNLKFRKQNIPPAVGEQFDAHGTGTLQSLTQLLNGGIDPSREFFSSPLSQAGTSGSAGALTVKEDSSFVVLGHPGETLKDGGIAAVLVDPLHAPDIDKLKASFPGVKFLPATEAGAVLPRVAAPGGKPVSYGKAAAMPTEKRATARVARGEGPARKIVMPPVGGDGLFEQPAAAGADRERDEAHNRERFANHFHYADPYAGNARTFDPKGDYNCGRCNMAAGDGCLLVKGVKIDRAAGSCGDWEDTDAGDSEVPLGEKTVETAGYGVAQNGKGFGCHRCPFASRAYAPDSRGRDLYCGKGDFRVLGSACCALNGAPVLPASPPAGKAGRRAKAAGSFFGDCDRDEGGHCKPQGQGGAAKPAGKPAAKPAPAAKPQAQAPAAAGEGEAHDDLFAAGVADVAGGAKAAVKAVGLKVWSKLPPRMQKVLSVSYGVGHKVLHTIESPLRAGKALAMEAARERGLDAGQVERVGNIIGLLDGVGNWVHYAPIGHHLAHVAGMASLPAFVAAKAAMVTPWAALAYTAYSTARCAMCTVRAAQNLVGKFRLSKLWDTGHEHAAVPRRRKSARPQGPPDVALVDALFARMSAAGDQAEWYEALVVNALDATGDLGHALQIADALFAEQPTDPGLGLEEALRDDGEKTGRPRTKAMPPAAPFLDVPNTRQLHDFDCGAACTRSVAEFFGVAAGRGEEDFIRELHTEPTDVIEDGTHWQSMAGWFHRAGLSAEAREGMTLGDLRAAVAAGRPVITPVQDYGTAEMYRQDQSGHYVVVCGWVPSNQEGLDPELVALAGEFRQGTNP